MQIAKQMQQDTTPTPGWYCDVPFEDYLEWPAINNTSLAFAKRSMAHFKAYVPNHATEATELGTLIHCGTLEPESLLTRYAVMPDIASQIRRPDGSEYANVRATKEYKAAVEQWRKANADKIVIPQDDWDALLGIVMALAKHDLASRWLDGGAREVSMVWKDATTGLLCKGRCDIWHADADLLVDLKTTRDGSTFEKQLAQYGYHRQAAFYTDAMHALTGRPHDMGIIAVEKEPPYAVRAGMVGPESMAQGRREYKRLLADIAEAKRLNIWPSYTDPADGWQLPDWAFEEVELKIGEEKVKL